METREFLDRVLPATGGYYYCNYGAKRLQQSLPLATIDDLYERIKQRVGRKENVYYAVGTYGSARTIESAISKKALYLDLDCGDGKGFENKAAAVQELRRFCVATSFPSPSIVVDSGRGIHCYWTLDAPLAVSEWIPLAEALKTLCTKHGFAADPPITADAARILRVPGTYNVKDPTHPIPCRVLHASAVDFAVDELSEKLVARPTVGPAAALVGQADADDLGGGQTYTDRKYFAGTMIEQCAALRHTRDTGGKDQAGALWHKILHLLAFTEDGLDFVHALSNGHSEYDAAATEHRFQYSLLRKERVGPTLCTTIEGFLPSKCATCPYRGNIKTPLVLGRTQESFLPLGWKMDKLGVHKPTKFDEKGMACDWVRVIPYMFSDVELYRTAHGNALQLTAHNGPRKTQTVVLGMDMAGDSRELNKALMQDNIMLTDSEVQEFRRIMIPWMRQMSAVRDAKPAPLTGLGWMLTGDKIGFATGSRIVMEDGAVSPVSGIDRTLAKEYSPHGIEQPWHDAVAAILADQCPAMQAAVLTAFAAPLLRFTGVQGVMFSLHSRESGTGKSSALRVAQAVWGDPVRGVNALNDTANSMAKKFGFLNNLPAYWDEVRMRDEVRSFVRMVFQLGQGKEKQRLNASAKMQEMGTWSTITTMATNEPVLDHVDAISSNTNAGRLRVFEVDVPARPLTDASVPFKIRDLGNNYGHVGERYAEWLARNAKTVDSLVQACQRRVVLDLMASNDERFWVALAATLLAAAHLAQHLNIFSISVAAFKEWLYQQFRIQRGGATTQFVPLEQRAVSAVIDFADKFRDQIVVCDHATSRAQKSVGEIHVQPPIREFLALLALKDKILRVKQSAFRAWVYETQQESPTEIITKLKELGTSEHKASLSAGIANTVNARVTVLDINLEHAAFKPVLEDYDEV